MCKLHFVRCKANPYIVPVCIRALAVFVCRKKKTTIQKGFSEWSNTNVKRKLYSGFKN